MLDLHRRVDKILNKQQQQQQQTQQQQPESGLHSAEESLTSPESEHSASLLHPQHAHQQPNVSPRSSLSSVSPPVSPNDVERQRKIAQHLAEAKQITDQLADLNLQRPKLSPIAEANQHKNAELEYILSQQPPQQVRFEAAVVPSLSPISEVRTTTPTTPTTAPKATTSAASAVSAAVSDESVAGDSGVYEAAASRQTAAATSAMSLETAQVQIKLRYSIQDSLLHIGVERARNLSALFIPDPHRKICVKASLLPGASAASAASNWTFCTRSIGNLEKPTFGENFAMSVPRNRLGSKTLQATIWSAEASSDSEESCLGSAQVSLADFDVETVSVKWYNILSFHFMHQPTSTGNSRQGTLKEESSDDSTVISSQTSTLTRNVGPEAMMAQAASLGVAAVGPTNDIHESEEEDSEEEEEETADGHKKADKETNTECVFVQLPESSTSPPSASALVKRSQTFTPSAPINKADYICRVRIHIQIIFI